MSSSDGSRATVVRRSKAEADRLGLRMATEEEALSQAMKVVTEWEPWTDIAFMRFVPPIAVMATIPPALVMSTAVRQAAKMTFIKSGGGKIIPVLPAIFIPVFELN